MSKPIVKTLSKSMRRLLRAMTASWKLRTWYPGGARIHGAKPGKTSAGVTRVYTNTVYALKERGLIEPYGSTQFSRLWRLTERGRQIGIVLNPKDDQ